MGLTDDSAKTSKKVSEKKTIWNHAGRSRWTRAAQWTYADGSAKITESSTAREQWIEVLTMRILEYLIRTRDSENHRNSDYSAIREFLVSEDWTVLTAKSGAEKYVEWYNGARESSMVSDLVMEMIPLDKIKGSTSRPLGQEFQCLRCGQVVATYLATDQEWRFVYHTENKTQITLIGGRAREIQTVVPCDNVGSIRTMDTGRPVK